MINGQPLKCRTKCFKNRTGKVVVRSFVPNCMITTLGANSSTTTKSYSLVLETVQPPIPCHLMSRSPSRLKFFAMCALKLRQRKSCTRQMKEWPRIKTRIGGMRKRKYNQRKYLPEKILLEIWPSWWRGREGRITGKIPRYTYLTLTPPYNLIG